MATDLPEMQKTITIDDLRAGDIIAFCPIGGSWLGRLIAAMTWPPGPPPFCHMAIVAPYESEGELAVYESTADSGLGSCLDAGEIVSGVQVHELMPRLTTHMIDREGEAFVLQKKRVVTGRPQGYELPLIEEPCLRLLGTPYDYRMAPAARSYFLGWTRFLRGKRKGSERRLFCSEFTTLVFKQLGLLGSGRFLCENWRICPEKYNPKGAARLYQKYGICHKPRKLVL